MAAQLLAIALEQNIRIGLRVQQDGDDRVLQLRIGGSGQMLSWARKLSTHERLADAVETLSAVALERCTRAQPQPALATVDGKAVASLAGPTRHLFRKTGDIRVKN